MSYDYIVFPPCLNPQIQPIMLEPCPIMPTNFQQTHSKMPKMPKKFHMYPDNGQKLASTPQMPRIPSKMP